MSRPPRLMLDSGPLGKLANPKRRPDVTAWLQRVQLAYELVLPEIADYEVRREFLARQMLASIRELDSLKMTLTYAPITTAVMLRAADLWADARRRGQPTADPKELDGDVILAAQAIEIGAVVATENVGHLARYVPAFHWSAIVP